MFPKDIKTKDDILKYVKENISNCYLNACIEAISDLADTYLIKYDDLFMFKTYQKFLRHSELLLAKSVDKYLITVLEENGYKCSFNKPGTLYIHGKDVYVHIFDFDKFMSLYTFPDSTAKCIYIVIAEESETFFNKINQLNKTNKNAKFMSFKSFVFEYINEKAWDIYFKDLFENLSSIVTDKKIFEIGKTYSEPELKKDCLNYLSNIDYKTELKQTCNCDFKEYNQIFDTFSKRKTDLIGDYDFAKSYITSEWLFKNQLKDNNLDKTFIVAGYLKSLEQLLFFYAKKTKKNLSVRMNKDFEIVPPNYEAYAKCTLGNLKHLLEHDKNCFEKYMESSSINQINKLLEDWINEERNGYFHKDNINKPETVIQIRKKTYLLYFLLLGSLDYNINNQEHNNNLIFLSKKIGNKKNLQGIIIPAIDNIDHGSISQTILSKNNLISNKNLLNKQFLVKPIELNPQKTGWILDLIKILDN